MRSRNFFSRDIIPSAMTKNGDFYSLVFNVFHLMVSVVSILPLPPSRCIPLFPAGRRIPISTYVHFNDPESCRIVVLRKEIPST